MSNQRKQSKRNSNNTEAVPVSPEWTVLRMHKIGFFLQGAGVELEVKFEGDEWRNRSKTQRQIVAACEKMRDQVEELLEQIVD